MDWTEARRAIAAMDKTVRATLCNGSVVDARYTTSNGPNYPISLLWKSPEGNKEKLFVGPDFFLSAGVEWEIC